MFLAGTEFFGEDEALREATRDLVSPGTLVLRARVATSVGKALATVATQVPGAPIDRIEIRRKGDDPTVAGDTGTPGDGRHSRHRHH